MSTTAREGNDVVKARLSARPDLLMADATGPLIALKQIGERDASVSQTKLAGSSRMSPRCDLFCKRWITPVSTHDGFTGLTRDPCAPANFIATLLLERTRGRELLTTFLTVPSELRLGLGSGTPKGPADRNRRPKFCVALK
jgi:hypothetical protein